MEKIICDIGAEKGSTKHNEFVSLQVKKMPALTPVKVEDVSISPCISPSPEEDCFSQDVLVPRSHQDSDLDCFFSSYSQGKQV